MSDHLERAAAKLDEFAASMTPPETGATAQPQPPALAESPCILGLFRDDVRLRGLVGENATAQLLFLAFTSRLLDKPVSVAVKGPSASGKSESVQQTRDFFPADAALEFTAASPKALIHSQADYAHRTIVFFEVTGLRENSEEDLTAYVLRSLLSEGRINYEYTAGSPNAGFFTRRVVKRGPTNTVFTTTKVRVHPENETRCLSLNTDDSPEQTKAIMLQLAEEQSRGVDLEPWHELQRWLKEAENRVTIPYGTRLAGLVPPVATRLRRDFAAVLTLIRTHAFLHQLNRDRDADGSIVANLDDYAVVRELVADVVAEGVGQTVPPAVRETVEAVEAVESSSGITAAQLARTLGIDKSNASRRLRRAADAAYVTNLEDKRGRPGRWFVGEPMPEEADVLPATATLNATLSATTESQVVAEDSGGGCAVALDSGGPHTQAREEGEV